MRQATILLGCLLVAATWASQTDASLDRFLFRRQTDGEQDVTTTPKSAQQDQSPPPTATQGQSTPISNSGNNGRLYPDLPQRPNFIPPFNAPPHLVQPPFVPFGMQMPGGNGPPLQLNADQQAAPFGRAPGQPRPMTPAERLQSQTFTDGLGKRLLSMIGIDMGNQTAVAPEAGAGAIAGRMDPATMRALQNATVLEKLSQRVHSLMGGLSKMYNSTIQEQMSLLNERLRKSAENSTNPWQLRMAEQVPIFYKNLVSRVGQAQEQMNRVWHDVTQAAQGNNSVLRDTRQATGQPGGGDNIFGAFNQFMSPDRMNFFGGGGDGTGNGGGFVDQLGRSLGFPPGGREPQQISASAQQANVSSQMPDMAMKLREFWHMQVQPQVGMLRGQMARVWRDLTTSGALAPITRTRSGSGQLGAGNSPRNASASNDLVDSILKEIDMDSNTEYALVDAKTSETSASTAESGDAPTATAPPKDDKDSAGNKMMTKLSPQMQNRLVEMQRDLNQLWMGLTNSLQAAIANARTSMSPRPAAEPMAAASSAAANQEADPRQNEIDDKISELSKLQRDADAIQQVVQQQQQRQRPSLGDRFRGFINNVDLSGMNQLPDRIGEQFNRFGSAVGNFWNQIPERWDNFMANSRQPTNRDSMMMA